ncbi:MAG TPA: M23 family metallopeptidase [Flavobacteriaceae bacterium]|nr:M23 family metallopeptidase [Flavobacteriaceae bacterium]
MKKICLLFSFLSAITLLQAQIPTDYFSNPLSIGTILSGNFGELRNNHFHSGLDIKTEQRQGLPIYASADGYVSRINVSHFGYGKALYIMHPNGYTTVYGHLQKYAGDIQKFVKEQQYSKESYEFEIFPDASVLPVKKGDLIAFSGNTGGSGGPHLHFEIRDGNQRPMNPMLFGFDIADNIPPVVSALYAYVLDDNSHINQSQQRTKVRLVKHKDGNYIAENIQALGRIGFGITAIDQLDGASNHNGVYQIDTKLNNVSSFKVRFDKFSFDETRYLNRYIDYEFFQNNKTRVQKLFREENNPLSIIVDETDEGYLTIKDSLDYSYVIEVKDFKGNTTSIIVPITGRKLEILSPRKIQETEDLVLADHATSISKGKHIIYFPPNALYEDTYLEIKEKGDTIKIHKDIVPIHKNITLTTDISNYAENDRANLYIGQIGHRGNPRYIRTTRKGDKLVGSIRNFGEFTVARDNTPPVVQPLNFSDGKWISSQQELRLRITDAHSGISSYRATINGKFILMEYEYKNNTLTYDFTDNIIQDAENNLKLVVIDNVGNSTTFEAKFFRKPN